MDRIEIEFSSARRPALVELTVCLCLCVMGPAAVAAGIIADEPGAGTGRGSRCQGRTYNKNVYIMYMFIH